MLSEESINQQLGKMITMTTALRDKIRRRMVVSAENHYVNIPKLLLSEEEETELEFERLRLIKAGSTSSSSSSGTAKGFYDTDSGISNTASSSCESFQSDHYLPDPTRDVVYDAFTPAFDPEEDDFDIKLSRSLANLGIGIGSGCGGRLSYVSSVADGGSYIPCSTSCRNTLTSVTDNDVGVYYENAGLVNYSNFDINLDEIGVDFDIVEPPPAFAEETSPDNEIHQLVVDSEAELMDEYFGEHEHYDREGCLNENDDNNYLDESASMEDLKGVLGNLIGNDGEASSSLVDGSNQISTPSSNHKTFPIHTEGSLTLANGSEGENNTPIADNSNMPKNRKSKKKQKRKRERYEIQLGFPCYNLELEDKQICIYSLQKNKDQMEDLLGHSKLKNSKCQIFSTNFCMFVCVIVMSQPTMSFLCHINLIKLSHKLQIPLFMTCLFALNIGPNEDLIL